MSTSPNNSHEFEGASATGDFSAALKVALDKGLAYVNQTSADKPLDWQLVTIKGHYGSMTGSKKLTVVIRSAGADGK